MSTTPRVQPGLKTLWDAEAKLIASRRCAAGLDSADSESFNPFEPLDENTSKRLCGVGLSGGGIRSATFCLGLFQALAGKHLVRHIDYLSTVSGGGYFGSFLGRMFTRRWAGENSTPSENTTSKTELRCHQATDAKNFAHKLSGSAVDRVEETLADSNSPPVRWLRESGNYLTPDGSASTALAVAIFTRNWLATLVVVLVFFLTIFLFGNFSRALLNSSTLFHNYEVWLQSLAGEHLWWTPWFFLPWLVAALVLVPTAWAYWLTQAGERKQFICVAIANLLVVAFGILAFRLLPPGSFCQLAIILGIEALLALLWIWGLGAYRCFKDKNRALLPDLKLVASIIFVSLLPVTWRFSYHLERPPGSACWLTASLLLLAVFHYLAIRAAFEVSPVPGEAVSWFGNWKKIRSLLWRPLFICWTVLVGLLPLLANLKAHWFQRPLGTGFLDIWAVLALLSALYFLAEQVLRNDERLRYEGKVSELRTLTSWLRSILSHILATSFKIVGFLFVLVLVNTLGQSLYALVTYSGGAQSVAALITGVFGLAGLAPIARAVAMRVFAIKEGLLVPLKIIALLIALLLAFSLLLSVSYISHAIAWGFGCPKLREVRTSSEITTNDFSNPEALATALVERNDPLSNTFWAESAPALPEDPSELRRPEAARRFLNSLNERLGQPSQERAALLNPANPLTVRRRSSFPLARLREPDWHTRWLLQQNYPFALTEIEPPQSVGDRIKLEWLLTSETGIAGRVEALLDSLKQPGRRRPGDPAATNRLARLATSPGAKLYARQNEARDVSLNDKRLIQVVIPQDDPRPNRRQTHMFILDLGFSWIVCLVLTFLFGRTITFLNLSSFHSFYTARLIRAYQGASNDDRWSAGKSIQEVDPRDDIGWESYAPHLNGGPLHLVNVALNSTVSTLTDMESTTAKGANLAVGPAGLSFGHRHAFNWLKNPSAIKESQLSYVVPRQAPKERSEWRIARGYRWLGARLGLWKPDPDLPALEPLPLEPDAGKVQRTVESLSLGEWVGISGAAFTTGLGNVGGGAGTSIGTSLLCGLFNIRLGYWWKTDFSPSTPGSGDSYLPTQTYLLDEFIGRFRVERRNRWYLSDGGHFENTAAYELIRRRLPFIIVSDAGADPDGMLDDIANLVRRVRVDFAAELKFLSDAELKNLVVPELLAPAVEWRLARSEHPDSGEEPCAVAGRIGTREDLCSASGPKGPRCVRAHAALAWVSYPNTTERSLIMFIKPGLTNDLPFDLLNYAEAEPDFPQQTTADQFFDEAQWESYRRLGEYVAGQLFTIPTSPEDLWYPALMQRDPIAV